MSWFHKHLHWTVILVWLATFPAGFIAGFVFGTLDPDAIYYSDEAWTGVGLLAALPVVAGGWGWVLRQKNRSLWWLLLAMLVPFGFLCMFGLENRNPSALLQAQSYGPGMTAYASPGPASSGAGHTPVPADLEESLAAQLPLEYCVKCGRQLEIRKVERKGFEQATGRPLYELILACPQAAFYETDLGASKISWQMGGGGHTIVRRNATGSSAGASFQMKR